MNSLEQLIVGFIESHGVLPPELLGLVHGTPLQAARLQLRRIFIELSYKLQIQTHWIVLIQQTNYKQINTLNIQCPPIERTPVIIQLCLRSRTGLWGYKLLCTINYLALFSFQCGFYKYCCSVSIDGGWCHLVGDNDYSHLTSYKHVTCRHTWAVCGLFHMWQSNFIPKGGWVSGKHFLSISMVASLA